MRQLTEKEKNEMRMRCAGLPYAEALIEGGRWLADKLILHWSGADVEGVLYGRSSKRKIVKKL